jgi:ATP-dependent Clp protease adaptor protein ClpS
MVTRKSGGAKREGGAPFTFELVASRLLCAQVPVSGHGHSQLRNRPVVTAPRETKAKTGRSTRDRETVILRGIAARMPPHDRRHMIDAVTKPKTKVRTKTERPRLHKVILVNDDFTPRDFVVSILKGEFRMTEEQAYKVMITAHRRGVCVVAVFTKDVAETKATRATDAGRAKGYPLLFTTEPEE